eukprot:Gregarina_sp_Pseudo_9__3288@NODE_346_length_3097_cov_8_513734_g326_i0_p2_GENE_NODE_346_length_3097_cov_8_513734_g326_i0NODE_346_length_3097_cov_8_513734_g326_i0_p2_ORF_typecomplete_len437_score56_72CRAL_TRIO/PF00650_20/5_6e35_NODE_346_length_3097_cov_8_513734_g326_i017823092
MGFLTFSPQKAQVQVHSSSITVVDPDIFSTASSPHLQRKPSSVRTFVSTAASSLDDRVACLIGRQLSPAQLGCLEAVLDFCSGHIFPQCQSALLRPSQPYMWTVPHDELGIDRCALGEGFQFNDEQLLFAIRFCCARSFVFEKVEEMLRHFLEFRSRHQVDNVICVTGRNATRLKLRATYPSCYFGVTKTGNPIYLDRPGHIDIKELTTIDDSALEAAWIQSYEHMQQVILPACSIATGKRISRGVTILDLEGVGISTFNARTRHILGRMIRISQDYYPESMDKMFIIRAPFIFNTIWRFVKPLLDRATVDKISVLPQKGDKLLQELRKYIDDANLPPFLVGADFSTTSSGGGGPWTDAQVLLRLKKAFPSLSDELVYLEYDGPEMKAESSPPPPLPPPSSCRNVPESSEQNEMPAFSPGVFGSFILWCKSALFGS